MSNRYDKCNDRSVCLRGVSENSHEMEPHSSLALLLKLPNETSIRAVTVCVCVFFCRSILFAYVLWLIAVTYHDNNSNVKTERSVFLLVSKSIENR